MGADEEATVRDLKAHQTVILPIIGEYGGRIIDTAGDGILAEFASVLNAMRCALAIQDTMTKRNEGVDPARRMQFRIGVNQGDIVHDDVRIYGDGVNIAARLEALAHPGGICISAKVYDEVRGRIAFASEDLGEQRLKNIPRAVRVYRVCGDATAKHPTHVPSDESSLGSLVELPALAEPGEKWSAWRVVGAALTAAMLLAVLTWFAFHRERPKVSPAAELPRPIAASAMPIIAVLPFANQTGDDSQEYFVDGVSEEIIDALGRFNTLRVLGRNAVLRYKKLPPTNEAITSELGASYVVTGSVRYSGKRVRISAQLSEPRAGTVMWSDRYDGERTDILEFQDTIAHRIAGALAANITQVEGRRQLTRPNPTAFDLVLRARAIGPAGSRTVNRQFRELITKAIELDSGYAAAHALFAEALYAQAVLGWAEAPDRELSRADAEARQAIALASNEPDGYRALGRILLARGEYEQAQNALSKAIEINPSDANALAAWGSVQSFSGNIDRAIDSLQLALGLDPMLELQYVFDLAIAYYLARRHEDALRIAERALARFPEQAIFNIPAAAAAARLGRKAEAARYVEVLRHRIPSLELADVGSRFKNQAHVTYLHEGLKAAGF